MPHRNAADVAYLFDDFSLSGRTLFREGHRLRLGSRAIDILRILVQRAGDLVSKDELLEQVWPDESVEEGNLRVHMSALRRALGDQPGDPRYIANVAGRGYRFIAAVQIVEAVRPSNLIPRVPVDLTRARLPGQRSYHTSALLGRDVEATIVEDNLSHASLVTIVGPGGIGKTTLAVAVAHRVRSDYADGSYFIDLAALSDAVMVPFAIASTLETSIDANEPISSLVEQIRRKRMLLVFDNCEHVIEEAARVVEAITRASPEITILATSHEPLLTEGEVTVRLLPFRLPAVGADLCLEDALDYPAIRLFVEHAVASDDSVSLADADVPHIIDICRRLDGVPLAIEIAAARAGAIGLKELAFRLDDRLKLLTGGRRTAALRHQELRNMLDWSYEHLTETDQTILRRLSVFASDFSVDAALAIVQDGHLTRASATDALARLLRRSLVATGTSGAPNLRLPESTRLYLVDKLNLAGEAGLVRLAHAEHLCATLTRAERDWTNVETPEWLGLYASLIDDIRNALSWCWSEEGNRHVGVKLTSLSMHLAWQIGQMAEFLDRGLAAAAAAAELSPRPLNEEMRLYIACQSFAFFQRLPADHFLEKASTLAEQLGTDRARIEVSIAWAMAYLTSGRPEPALAQCRIAQACAKREGDDMAELAANKVLAQVQHFLGDQTEAIALANQVLRHKAVKLALYNGFIHSDRRVSMRVILARAMWMTGHATVARQISAEAIHLAKDAAVPTMCQVLSLAEIPILLWNGSLDEARPRIEQLREEATRLGFGEWLIWAETFDEAYSTRDGDDLNQKNWGHLHGQELVTFTGLEPSGADVETTNWCTAERYRARGELKLRQGQRDEGIAQLLAALELAKAQGALAWELRAATSLAQAWAGSHRSTEGLRLLTEVLERLPQDNASTDAWRARSVLARMKRATA